MSTLQDLSDYFKGDKVPDVHPFQKLEKVNTYLEKYNDVKTPEKQFGYDKDKVINSNKDYDSVKKKSKKG